MTRLPIIIAPDPRLKNKSLPVPCVNDEVRKLMDDMLDTMHAAKGIGLSAPQIGVHKHVIVADIAKKEEPPAPLCMANPEIIWASEEKACNEEGCLSLPEQFAEVTRPAMVRVRYLDRDGHNQELEASGLLSRCIQHEMDHLKGTLFVDHISALRRQIILRKLAKAKKLHKAKTG